jgi:CRP/FNR family transcriptional regulator, cyclic AMP receptor protein
MSKAKHPAAMKPAPVDWSGARTRRLECQPGTTIFAQGDPATSIMYVDEGTVRLSVLSHAGKEAVIAVLDAGHFFGEGCLAGPATADGDG